MRRGALGVLLAWIGFTAMVRGEDRLPALLLPPAPIKATSAKPIRHYDDDLPQDLPKASAPRNSDTAAKPEREQTSEPIAPKRNPDRPRSAGLARPTSERTIPARLIEDRQVRQTAAEERTPFEDFLLPSRERRRDQDDDDRAPGRAMSFRKRLARQLAGDGKDEWFRSDHSLDTFISPVSSPFLAEDPRALTELRPIFIYQKIPNSQGLTGGGSLTWFGVQGRVAVTDRLSFVVNKFGFAGLHPSNQDVFENKVGFSEIWLGPKYTIVRDPNGCHALAIGATFQIPLGSSSVFQDTGDLSIAPYITGGINFFRTRMGSFNALATAGYAFSTDKVRSDYVYVNTHLDFDVGDLHKFYPFVELNWLGYTSNGGRLPYGVEGHDLINFGGQAKGSNLLTCALGAKYKFSETWHLGGYVEFPLTNNKDLFDYRIGIDLTWRY